jgi:Leucine-rich repeat (LRR) protein
LHSYAQSNLRELPMNLGKLQTLTSLNLSHCSRLERLPDSIGELAALKALRLKNCVSLEAYVTLEF